ncbi:MAG: Coenzyme F420 hydrogenase/dehydrogenase, beta subunit C-terminal domain [Kiritimatiellae bacterium]|nr:Coenzyme F420 hydrogenase/dehydrogenase, beta subunit C-terminal domain [Kiritimatiellia bacterium]
MPVRVSVIVAMRNCGGQVRECLDSLRRQTLRDFEVLCVDGGSTDDTAAVCLEYAARDPRVKILRLGRCTREAMCRVGKFNASGDLVFYLDSGRTLEPEFLEAFVSRPHPPPPRPPLWRRALRKARVLLKKLKSRVAARLRRRKPVALPPTPPATLAPPDGADKSVKIVNPDRCTGCGACANKCPKDALAMEPSPEGFLFPKVKDGCINCGLCLKACPCVNPPPLHPVPRAYAAMADDATRAVSSSGGMVSLLARDVFAQGGSVYGATWADGRWSRVVFVRATDEAGLSRIRGSKYLQSEIAFAYRDAKKDLDAGMPVLFTGCPCQIAGLYSFLGRDYENLLTADIVCHGANPATAWNVFLKEYAAGRKLTGVNFRDKRPFGWATPAVIYTEEGTVAVPAGASAWYYAFLKGVMSRECCYTCRYAGIERVGDISLGDCWGCTQIASALSDGKGTSLVLPNTQRGEAAMARIREAMLLWRAVPLMEARRKNGQLIRPTRKSPGRETFFRELDRSGFHIAVAKAIESKEELR